jgi:DNA-binding NarL/FixJ family response regulator
VLTRAELDVLFGIAEDETIAEAAERLGCSEGTIARRRKMILSAFGTRTLAAAVAAAYHRGLLVAPPTRTA